MKKIIILLLLILMFLMTVAGSAKTVASFKNLNNPEMIFVYNNRIYIVDMSQVKVFSLIDFKPLFKFGRRGVGPGELFRNEDYYIQMQIRENHIYLNSRNKIIKYTLNGKIVEENTFRLVSWQIIPLKKDFAMVVFSTAPSLNRMLSLKIVDPRSRIKKILYSYEFMNPNKTRQFLLLPNLLLVRPYKNRIYVFDRKNGFPMLVFDDQGTFVDKIDLSMARAEVTEKFKDEVWDWLELNKRWKRRKGGAIEMVFPKYFPQLKNFVVNDNLIFCQTYKKKGEMSEFIVVNLKGKRIKQIFLPHADRIKMDLWTQYPSYAIAGGKYYYLVENLDAEAWELRVVDLDKLK